MHFPHDWRELGSISLLRWAPPLINRLWCFEILRKIPATLHPYHHPQKMNCGDKMKWKNVYYWHGHSRVQDPKASDPWKWQSLPTVEECMIMNDWQMLASTDLSSFMAASKTASEDLLPRLANTFLCCMSWTWCLHRQSGGCLPQKESSPPAHRFSVCVSIISSSICFLGQVSRTIPHKTSWCRKIDVWSDLLSTNINRVE